MENVEKKLNGMPIIVYVRNENGNMNMCLKVIFVLLLQLKG